MTIELADYQKEMKQRIYDSWNAGNKVVMPVLPTGSGKTVLMGSIAHDHNGYGCSIAHRSTLIGQVSLALAREGVRHDIIAPKSVIRNIVQSHMDELKRTYYDNCAPWKVASVDTLIRRNLDPNWARSVSLVFQDEGHHVLADNKWGRAFAMFPNAKGMFPTATPERADGKGLGRHADGIVDDLIVGVDMRWLIDNGHLTNYRILAPTPSSFSMDGIEVSAATGDYNVEKMRERVKSNTAIIGDVVKHYLMHCKGQLGITFAVDVEHATSIAKAFNSNGVPAVIVTADTPEHERNRIMQDFKVRKLLQLVNVDLFGEGVDVPAVEVVSMARPTASYALYAQQFGRALRLLVDSSLRANWHKFTSEHRLAHIAASAKPVATIIDHVGNVITHYGPPDWRTKPWTLDARQKSRAADGIPLRACGNAMCLQPFERMFPACPYCGWVPEPPAERGAPEFVDGDLVLYSDELLAKLFGEKEKIDGPCYVPKNATPIVAASIKKNHRERQEAQQDLRSAISLTMPPTVDQRVAQRRFFHTFGIDTLTAQTLGRPDAAQLTQKIVEKLQCGLTNGHSNGVSRPRLLPTSMQASASVPLMTPTHLPLPPVPSPANKA